jgi:phosphatidylserine/phosphatidylglycerophosphate/cardiolipin synthase-like enzyme
MEKFNGQVTPIIGAEYPKVVVPLIDSAKQSINILMFDWRWYFAGLGSPAQEFNQALIRAHRRGVKVQCLINSMDVEQNLKNLGLDAKRINSKNLLHSKLVLIDQQLTVIGSHNISSHAFEKNFETSCLIECPEIVSHYKRYFDALWRL